MTESSSITPEDQNRLANELGVAAHEMQNIDLLKHAINMAREAAGLPLRKWDGTDD